MIKTITEVKNMVDELVKMGEDPDEFSFWLAVYETLPNSLKLDFSNNLESEIKELKVTFNLKSI